MSTPVNAPTPGESMGSAIEAPLPPPATEADVLAFLQKEEAQENRHSRLTAAAVGVVGVGAAVGVYWMNKYGGDLQVGGALPFVQKAQEIVIGVDDKMVPVGEVGLPLTVMGIAAVKIRALAPANSLARFADRFSSREPSSEGARQRGGLFRKVGIATAGAALATFTGGIASAVSHGPNDPIEVLHQALPGDSVLVSHQNAMPMVQSDLNRGLADKVRETANAAGVPTHFYQETLSTYDFGKQHRTDLLVGIETPASSPLHWTPEQGCDEMPVEIDKTVGAKTGAKLVINGVPAKVVGHITQRASSMNRIGVVADLEAVETCVEQDPNGPLYGVTMETTPDKAGEILAEAKAGMDVSAPAAIITPEQEIKNSEEFWKANVKPITNVLSLVAGGVSLLAMAGATASRLLRNRRELGAKLAAGVAPNAVLGLAETVRSAKDGVMAAIGGVAIGAPMAVGASMLESGFRVEVGFREAMIGTAVALVGSVGGGLLSLLRLKRVANPEENTRI